MDRFTQSAHTDGTISASAKAPSGSDRAGSEGAGLNRGRNRMVSRVHTVAFNGIDVLDIDCQVQLSSGIVAFNIVGLADKAVAESRERVRAALAAMGLALPPRRITVNLAPADVLMEGAHFDLPVAVALLRWPACCRRQLTRTLKGAAWCVRRRRAARQPGPAISRCWRRRRGWR
jgi:hypothetical protein